jgi:NAD(P)-dependent dehydrogenase (short-subunit alcohol dehydrogenase family)
MAQGKYGEYLKNGVVAGTPLGRLGTPDEIASSAVFLASSVLPFYFVGPSRSSMP